MLDPPSRVLESFANAALVGAALFWLGAMIYMAVFLINLKSRQDSSGKILYRPFSSMRSENLGLPARKARRRLLQSLSGFLFSIAFYLGCVLWHLYVKLVI